MLSTVDPNAPANFVYQVDWGDGNIQTIVRWPGRGT